jgi:hypothetical protein
MTRPRSTPSPGVSLQLCQRLRPFCSNGELTPLDPLATTILAATVVVRRQDGALMDAAPPEVTLAEAVLGKGRAAADGAEQC